MPKKINGKTWVAGYTVKPRTVKGYTVGSHTVKGYTVGSRTVGGYTVKGHSRTNLKK